MVLVGGALTHPADDGGGQDGAEKLVGSPRLDQEPGQQLKFRGAELVGASGEAKGSQVSHSEESENSCLPGHRKNPDSQP